MSTNFPGSLDSYVAPVDNDIVEPELIANYGDAIEALEARVGVTGSAVATSLTKRIADLEAVPSGGGPYPQAYLRAANRISNVDPLRAWHSPALGVAGGHFNVSFFTAAISLTATNIRYGMSAVSTSGAGSGFGLYSVDASDNLTLLTSVTGTSIFNTTGWNTAAWAVPQALTAGSRYAVGALHLGGGTPSFAGIQYNSGIADMYLQAPKIAGLNVSQASLPATFAAASLNNIAQNMFYVELY